MPRNILPGRRGFLAGAGKLGVLLLGGPYIAAASGPGGQAQEASADVRPAKEKTKMVRLLGVMQRGPGFSKSEIQVKSQQSYWAFARNAYPHAVKQLNWDQLQHIQNVVTDSAFGVEGQTPRTVFNPDVVAEFAMEIDVPGAPPPRAGAAGAGPCRWPLPEFIESGTQLTIVARQVFAEGTRPATMDGREKGLYFFQMSAVIPVADQLKTLQALHARAIVGSPAFASALMGYEVLQRLPEVPPAQCAAAVPAPDLVATFWFKSNRGALQVPNYARALRAADERKAIDAAASFFLRVEEWESRTGPEYVG